MLKHVSICAALIAFSVGTASAQQREAVLQKMEVPGAAFDIILAMPKSQGAIFDLSGVPGCARGAPDWRQARPRV